MDQSLHLKVSFPEAGTTGRLAHVLFLFISIFNRHIIMSLFDTRTLETATLLVQQAQNQSTAAEFSGMK